MTENEILFWGLAGQAGLTQDQVPVEDLVRVQNDEDYKKVFWDVWEKVERNTGFDVEAVAAVCRAPTTNRIQEIHRDISNLKRRIAQKLDEASDCRHTINSRLVEMMKLEANLGKGSGLEQEIRELLEEGWYKFQDARDGVIYFTTPMVVCTRAADEDNDIEELSVPLGSYQVRYYVASGNVRVCGYVNTFEYDEDADSENVHPHVSTSHCVCWGNAENDYTEMKATGVGIKNVLQRLRTILTTFNAESPYEELEWYADRVQIQVPITYKYVEQRTLPLDKLLKIIRGTEDVADEFDTIVVGVGNGYESDVCDKYSVTSVYESAMMDEWLVKVCTYVAFQGSTPVDREMYIKFDGKYVMIGAKYE